MVNEELLILCHRTSVKNELKHIELNCVKCNHRVTISDSTISAVKQHFPERDLIKNPVSPICFECYTSEKKETDEILPFTSDQINDILKI